MKNKCRLICLLLFQIFNTISAQPYYYLSNYKEIDSVNNNFLSDVYRINLNSGVVDTLFSNYGEVGLVFDAETNNWLTIDNYNFLEITNLTDTSFRKILSDLNQGLVRFDRSTSLNKFIICYNDVNYFNSIISVNPTNFEITDTLSQALMETNIDYNLSKNGEKIYFLNRDTVTANLQIITYSLANNQILNNNNLSLFGYPQCEGYLFNFRRYGKGVIESYYTQPSFNSYFNIYDFDKDSSSSFIHYNGWAEGYESNDGKYLILFVQLADQNLDLYASGLVNIYEMGNSALVQTINLPSNGKVYYFNNYPNNLYYVTDIELPTRQIFNLKMDSIFNVLDLTSLSPSSKIVNSPPFTLTVNGHGFDTLSTVYFNGGAKTTTYLNDSVLTAAISTSDISAVGNYPVWVTDEWGTSDTLMFAVTPQPADLSSLSPAIALTYDPLYWLEYFTVTVSGNNFDTASVIYFNGNAKTTTFVSDSVLTFQARSYDVGVNAHTIPLWVSNNGAISDTLTFYVQTSLSNPIYAVFSCVEDRGETFKARLGYNNTNNVSVFVPIGTKNQFLSSGQDKGQPKIFMPGDHTDNFIIDFDGDETVWQLMGSEVQFSKKSDPCE